jgi:hypothetical protein
MRVMKKRLAWFFIVLSIPAQAQTLVENFNSIDQWDAAATQATGSPGVWNTNVGQSCPCAQAPVVDNGAPSSQISFGDGSDGALDSSSGFAFDTDAHPNGYNFSSVNITGGAVTVTGSNPLMIHSLTTVNIAPSINLNGGSGGAGEIGAIVGAGGSAPSSTQASGGAGGSSGSGGSAGHLANGTAGGGAGGTACAAGICASARGAQSFPAGVPGNFDGAGFIGGGAAGGGAGNATAGGTGGGGGAGGGAIQITALGMITVQSVVANGGGGGSSACDGGNVDCSGNGAGGNGGSIWFQSFNGIATPATVLASAGIGGSGPGSSSNGFAGKIRGDEPGAPAAWSTGGGVVPSIASTGTFFVVSKSYDLGTYNAVFSTAPTVTPNAPAQFAASSDGVSFTPFTSDITTLSNQNYRYIKFQIILNAATQNFVNSISIPYNGPALDSVDLGLAAGCASLERVRTKDGTLSGGGGSPSGGSSTGALILGFWALFYFLVWRIFTGFRPFVLGR